MRWVNPFKCFVLLGILIQASCAVPELMWHPTEWDGPLVEGNHRPKVVTKQSFGFQGIGPSRGYAAFVDHHGRKLDIQDDFREVLDEYLINIMPLHPWLNQRQANSPGWKNNSSQRYDRLPFRLHVLTISPIVVLAVPEGGKNDDWYCGYIKDGCIRSVALRNGGYFFRREPKVVSGSFWFSPELAGSFYYLPTESNKETIEVNGARIELEAKNGYWQTHRNMTAK